jgi:hypothetical protein
MAWIDDGHDAQTEAWAAERAAPTVLVRTEPAVGLTGEQVESLLAWAARRADYRLSVNVRAAVAVRARAGVNAA